MSSDEIGGTTERRIQLFNEPGKEEQIARQIRMHINSLNGLLKQASEIDLDVELYINEPEDEDDDPTHIVIEKLRIEKDC